MVARRIAQKCSTQKDLEKALHTIFPNHNIVNNSRRASNLVSPLSGRYLELDIWIPDLKLSFEFQDPHHYTSTYYAHSNVLESTQQKDESKKDQAGEKGETLIIIPCWWDGSIDRLVATIRSYRRELAPGYPIAPPIPLSPPRGFFNDSILPDVGELMTASFPSGNFTPKSWWIGEKYEGLRAYWHGEYKKLYGKSGKEFALLPSFHREIPTDLILECEIWLGRGQENTMRGFTSQLTKRSRNTDESHLWQSLRLIAYNSPIPTTLSFESRYASILAIPTSHAFITNGMCCMCKGKLHAKNIVAAILNDGGDGVYFWNPKSIYKSGRSDDVIQLNTRKGQEGLVIGEDNGLYIILLPNREETVAARPPDYDLPDLGDVVTLVYPHSSHEGIPSEPKIESIITETTWSEVLLGFRTPKTRLLGDKELKSHDESSQNLKSGHWTDYDQQNAIQFFNDFARTKNGNPQDPKFWYTVKRSEIKESKGAGILYHYNGSLVNALISIYPSIGLKPEEFANVTRNYWRVDENRRKVFDNFAKKHHFDPLIPENWYSVTRDALIEEGAATVLAYYPGSSVAKALLDLYPDIGLELNKFNIITRWTPTAMKLFFDRFAKKNNFDPLKPGNWYSVTRDSVLEEEGATSFLHHHFGGSLIRALLTVYPDIGLVEKSFSTFSNKTWHPVTKRKFFDNLAKKLNFDPLVVENWYPISKDIVAQHGGKTLLDLCHGGSIARALYSIYPNLKFIRSRFQHNKSPM